MGTETEIAASSNKQQLRRTGLGRAKYRILGWQAAVQGWIAARQAAWFPRSRLVFEIDRSFTEMVARFPERNATHAYASYYFTHHLPVRLCEHRAYFRHEQRGFGEDALHAMWWMLLKEFRPKRCLEIGVFRGQVISLWALIAQMLNYTCEIHGISPFTSLGDRVSVYRTDVDFLSDVQNSFRQFGLPAPTLVRALSTDLEAKAHIANQFWDLIYIDGSHDYNIVLADYRLCKQHVAPGGLLVLDDASLGTSFRPPMFAFGGHPGPSRVASEFAAQEMRFLGAVGHNNVFQNVPKA